MKKLFKKEELTFGEIKTRFALFGFTVSEEEFNNMTYSEINKLLKKARKSYYLRMEVYQAIENKNKGEE